MNACTLSGRLTWQPELRYQSSGKPELYFRLAVPNGEKEGKRFYLPFDVTVFGQACESLAESLEGWGWPTVKAVFSSMAERCLDANQEIVYLLAKAVVQQCTLHPFDCASLVGYGKSQYSFTLAPLLRSDWRAWLARELACQRAVERLTAEEVARSQALAAEHAARAPNT